MSAPYPRYYAVNDRPVKIERLPTGETTALVASYATGLLVRDLSYLSRVHEVGVGKDVDALDELAFELRMAVIRRDASRRRHELAIEWRHTGDGEFPYRAEVDGHTLVIRVNDFPAEPLYTLLVDDQEAEDLEDWPAAWRRPGSRRDAGPHRAGEVEPSGAAQVREHDRHDESGLEAFPDHDQQRWQHPGTPVSAHRLGLRPT